MKDAGVAEKYAQAVFLIAKEKKLLGEYKEHMLSLRDAFSGTPELFTLFTSLFVSRNIKKNIIGKIFKDRLPEEVLNFLMILIEKRREKMIFLIIDCFLKAYYEDQNIEEVEVTTPMELSDDLYKKIADVYSKKLSKEVILIKKVKAGLIGGIIVKIKDNVTNDSFNYFLMDIKEKMSAR